MRAWVAEGRLELRAARIDGVEARPDALRVLTDTGPLDVAHLLLATGPDESPAASPFLAATMAAGLARPGPLDLGIDVHPYDFRVRDAAGAEARPLFALGPIIRGSVWETIAIPEIRLEAVRIAEQILARGPEQRDRWIHSVGGRHPCALGHPDAQANRRASGNAR